MSATATIPENIAKECRGSGACLRPSCEHPVPPQKIRRGKPKVYCSDACARLHWFELHPRVDVRQRPLPFAPAPEPLIQPRDQRVRARRRAFSRQAQRILARLEAGPVANVELALMFPPATAWRSRLSDVRWELRRRLGLVKDEDPDPIPGYDCGSGIVWHWIERV